MSATQISEMYSANYANTPTPNHHFSFCEASGSVVRDLIGRSIELTFTGTFLKYQNYQGCAACMEQMGFNTGHC